MGTEVKERYENLTEETKERVEKITKVAALSRKFVGDSDYLRKMLDESEHDLAVLDAKSCKEQGILEDITHAKEIVNTHDDMKPRLEKLKGVAEELKSMSVTDHFDALSNHYEKVKKNADEKFEKLRKIKGVVKQLKDSTEPVEELFDKIEEALDEHPQFENVDEKKIEKEVKNIEVLIDALEDIQPKFVDIKNLESELT